VAFSEPHNLRSKIRVLYILLSVTVVIISIATIKFSNEQRNQDEETAAKEIDQIIDAVEEKIFSEVELVESDQDLYESEWPDPAFSESLSVEESKYIESLSITIKVPQENLEEFLTAEQSVNSSYELKFPGNNPHAYLALRNSDGFYADFVGADLTTFGTDASLESSASGVTLMRDDVRESSPFTKGSLLEVRVRGTTLGADDVSYESWTSGQINLTEILQEASKDAQTGLFFTATNGQQSKIIFSNSDNGRNYISKQQRSINYGSFSVEFEFLFTNEFYPETATSKFLVFGWLTALALLFLSVFELVRSSFEEKSRRSREQALTDQLTGLPNRRWLDEYLAEIELTEGEQLAILFIDLDEFKEINDRHGHEIGDSVLVGVAERLNLEQQDELLMPMRLAGDEFLMIGIIKSDSNIQNTLEDVAKSVLSRVKEPLELGEISINPSASVGIATSDLKFISTKDLLRQADEALYHAKNLDNVNYYCDLTNIEEPEKKLSNNMFVSGIELRYRTLRDSQGEIAGFEVSAFDTGANRVILFEDVQGSSHFLETFYSELMEQVKILKENTEPSTLKIWIRLAGYRFSDLIDYLVKAAEKHSVDLAEIVLVTNLESYAQKLCIEDSNRANFENVCLIDPFKDLSKLDAMADERVKYVLLEDGLGSPGDQLVKELVPNLAERYDLTFVCNDGSKLLPNNLRNSLFRENYIAQFHPVITPLPLVDELV